MRELDSKWLKAATIGSLWASIEIVLGSFLHNLRVPVTGAILAAIGVCLMVAMSQIWSENGIFWRAGIICAVMKSFSPSAVIFGPMIGIFIEGLILEFAIAAFGRNIFSYIFGGALAVASTLLQNIIGLLIIYGFNLVQIYLKLYQFASKSLGIYSIGPWDIIFLLFLIHFAFGAIASIFGYVIGRKSFHTKISSSSISLQKNISFLEINPEYKFSFYWLIIHCVYIIVSLVIISYLNILFSLGVVFLYIGICFKKYNRALNRLKKIRVWIEFIIIILLAAALLGGLQDFNKIWDGLLIGFQMILRATLIIIGFSAISIEIRNPKITNLLLKMGMGRFYYALELAFEALPSIMSNLVQQKHIFKKPLLAITDLINSANDLLIEFNNRRKTNIFIITGEQGSGKTSMLESIISQLKEKGFLIGGILAPGYWKDGKRLAFDVINVFTNERKLLCNTEKSDSEPAIGQFYFKKEGLELGKTALSSSNLNKTDLIVIDEIGKLELEGKGWSEFLDKLIDGYPKPMILVVRKNFIEDVNKRWDFIPELVFDLENGEASEKFVGMILQNLRKS